jgi:hypothetical protein
MKKHLLLSAGLLTLSACALNRLNASDYAVSGKDKTTVEADEKECGQKAVDERPSGFNDTLAVETQYNKIFDACMAAKGYTRR